MSLEARDLTIVATYALGIGLLSLATPIAVQALIDFVAFGGLLQPILVLAAILCSVLVFVAILKVAQTYAVELISRRIFLRVANRVSRRVVRPTPGTNLVKLTNRFFDVVTLEKASSVLLFDGISVVLQIAAGMALLAVYHPLLLAFDVVCAVLIALIVLVPARGAVRTALEESTAKFALADWLEELAQHPDVFHSHRGGQFADGQTAERLRTWLEARQRHFRRVLAQTSGFLALQALAMTALLGLGGWLVIERELAVGQLIAAELVMAATVASVARLGKLLQKSYDVLAALSKIASVTDQDVSSGSTEALPQRDPRGLAIKVRRDGEELELDAGAQVRLVGPEGSGKTHLLDALTHVRAESFHIELAGIDARMLDRCDVADAVHLLGAGGVIEGTIEENLRAVCGAASAADISAALAEVELTEVVARLPAGLQTRLALDGAPLSGTQMKRLLVARVLLARPQLLLVDRFLDDLPDQPLDKVANALFGPGGAWTVLCVSDDPRVIPWLKRQAHVPGVSPQVLAPSGVDGRGQEGS